MVETCTWLTILNFISNAKDVCLSKYNPFERGPFGGVVVGEGDPLEVVVLEEHNPLDTTMVLEEQAPLEVAMFLEEWGFLEMVVLEEEFSFGIPGFSPLQPLPPLYQSLCM